MCVRGNESKLKVMQILASDQWHRQRAVARRGTHKLRTYLPTYVPNNTGGVRFFKKSYFWKILGIILELSLVDKNSHPTLIAKKKYSSFLPYFTH